MDIYDVANSKTVTKQFDTFLFQTQIKKNNKIANLSDYESAVLLLADENEQLLTKIEMDMNLQTNVVSCIVPRSYIESHKFFYFQVKLTSEFYRHYVPTTRFEKINVIDNLNFNIDELL